MTRNLIEAIFGATLLDPTDEQIDEILATPAVQAALAKVRGEGVHEKALRQIKHSVGQAQVLGNDWKRELKLIDNLAAEALATTPKPEPVLRWEGDRLMLGSVEVGAIYKAKTGGWDWSAHMHSGFFGWERTEELAQAATEETVRDWLKRAGCV